MTVYRGCRSEEETVVEAGGQPLPLRSDLHDYRSPSFEWGSRGPGSAQLALALLAHCLGDSVALEYHEEFLLDYVVKLRSDGWGVAGDVIQRWYAERRRSEDETDDARMVVEPKDTTLQASRLWGLCAALGILVDGIEKQVLDEELDRTFTAEQRESWQHLLLKLRSITSELRDSAEAVSSQTKH